MTTVQPGRNMPLFSSTCRVMLHVYYVRYRSSPHFDQIFGTHWQTPVCLYSPTFIIGQLGEEPPSNSNARNSLFRILSLPHFLPSSYPFSVFITKHLTKLHVYRSDSILMNQELIPIMHMYVHMYNTKGLLGLTLRESCRSHTVD